MSDDLNGEGVEGPTLDAAITVYLRPDDDAVRVARLLKSTCVMNGHLAACELLSRDRSGDPAVMVRAALNAWLTRVDDVDYSILKGEHEERLIDEIVRTAVYSGGSAR